MIAAVDLRLALVEHLAVVALIGVFIDEFICRRLVSTLAATTLGMLGGLLWFDHAVYAFIASPVLGDDFAISEKLWAFAQFWLLPIGVTYLALRAKSRLKSALTTAWTPRYRLRSALVAVTVFSIICFALATICAPLRREWNAASQVERSGGRAYWSGGHVTAVYLNDTIIDGAVIRAFDAFPKLGTLIMSRARLTDDDIGLMGNLRALEILELDGTQITDRSIAQISELRSLAVVDVRDTKISADAVRWLAQQLPNTRVVTTWESKWEGKPGKR